jgi:hypothetical protein
MVALQPYFSQSIYQNWPEGESFWALGNHNNQHCVSGEWVVVPTCRNMDAGRQDFYRLDRYYCSIGFIPVHRSQGSMFFEGPKSSRQTS